MRLTKQSNYALRAVIYCAIEYPKLSRVGEIAEVYSISEMFLFKIIKHLVDSGIVKTVRGRNGGIKLAKPPADISIYEIIIACEEFYMIESVDSAAPLVGVRELDMVFSNALDAFFDAVRDVTIEDLIREQRND